MMFSSLLNAMGSYRFSPLSVPTLSFSRASSPDLDCFLFRKEDRLDSQRYDPSLKSPRNSPKIQPQRLSRPVPDFITPPNSPASTSTAIDDSHAFTVVGSDTTTAASSPRTTYRKVSIETLDLYFNSFDAQCEHVSRETSPRFGPVLEPAVVAEEEVSNGTCKIIRPIPSFSILSIFTRPSTPTDSAQNSPITRPTSPFYSLSCCASSSNFEDDVDYFQEKREKERSGEAEVKVEIMKEKEVHAMESKWKQTVNSIMFDQEQAAQYLKEKTEVR